MKRPCLTCGVPSEGPRCAMHRRQVDNARSARRGTTTQRGLGAEHQRQRNALIRKTNPAVCPRCGSSFTATNPITAEHGVARAHGGSEITGLICRSCNSSLGATIRRA